MEKESKYLVSVIIPVYNGSNYIRKAIESVINQNYKNFEIIVVDDGSNDNGESQRIANEYDKHVKYFYKSNGGVSTAINYGVNKSNGDYISWLSHDDEFLKDHLYDQMLIQKNNDNIVTCSQTSSLINEKYDRKKESERVIILSSPSDAFDYWLYACALVIPKNIYISMGGLNEGNKTAQDIELIWNILSKYKIYLIKKTNVLRRIHNMQGTIQNQVNNINDINSLVKKYIELNGLDYFSKYKSKGAIKDSISHLKMAAFYYSDQRLINHSMVEYILEKSVEYNNSYFNVSKIFYIMPRNMRRYILMKYNSLKKIIIDSY